ncbi:MAG TPA: preprotein translocase subunit YajC [Phycisphaerae bacterium]|nr:preprotein translocase subunit YajC [Phycisphaerae bacterium]
MAIHDRRYLRVLAACLTPAAICLWAVSPAWADDKDDKPTPTSRIPERTDKGDTTTKPADGQGGAPEKKDGQDGGAPAPCGRFGGSMTPLFIVIGVFLLMYIFMGSSRRKTAAKRREMLANIKKGDKVTSIGGIIGTVVELREDEVVVKVDDNTRMHLARWAVRGVGEEAKAEQPGDKK